MYSFSYTSTKKEIYNMIAPNETAPNFKQIMKYSQPSVICTAIEQCGTCNYGSSLMIMEDGDGPCCIFWIVNDLKWLSILCFEECAPDR